jgi:hypothetical protein
MARFECLFVIFVISVGFCAADVEIDEPEASSSNDYPQCHKKNLQWFPHQLNCSRYFLCHHGNAIERSCAPGLFFNDETGQCMIPELANCQLTCPAKDDPEVAVFLPDLNDCSRFFICYNGQAIHRSCAEGLLFDEENDWCDFDFLIECGHRGNGTGYTTTTEASFETTTKSESTTTEIPPPENTDPITTPPTTTTRRTTTTRTTTQNPDSFVSSDDDEIRINFNFRAFLFSTTVQTKLVHFSSLTP